MDHEFIKLFQEKIWNKFEELKKAADAETNVFTASSYRQRATILLEISNIFVSTYNEIQEGKR